VSDFLCRTFEAGHVHFHRLAELRRLLEDAGLERVEGRSVWGGVYGIALAHKAGPRAAGKAGAAYRSA